MNIFILLAIYFFGINDSHAPMWKNVMIKKRKYQKWTYTCQVKQKRNEEKNRHHFSFTKH